MAGSLGTFIGGGASGANPYSGPLTANLGGNEKAALTNLQNAALNPVRQNAITSFASGANVNPYINAAVNAAVEPLLLAQDRELGRRLPGAFAAAGQSGGGSTAYNKSLGEAGYLTQRAIGDTAAATALPAFNQAQNAQLQGIQLGQQDIGALIANLQAQGLPRSIEDLGISRAIALGQQGTQNWLQGLSIAQGLPLQATGNVSQTTGQSPNLLTGLFGNQGAFGGLNSSLAPTLAQNGQITPNATIFNTPGLNPFSGLFG